MERTGVSQTYCVPDWQTLFCYPQKEKMKIKIQQLVEKVRRSPSDNGSFEVQGKWKSRSVLFADDTSLVLFCCSHPGTSSFLYQGGESQSTGCCSLKEPLRLCLFLQSLIQVRRNECEATINWVQETFYRWIHDLLNSWPLVKQLHNSNSPASGLCRLYFMVCFALTRGCAVVFAVVPWVPITVWGECKCCWRAAALTWLLLSFIVAILTAKIRTYQEHLQRHPKVTGAWNHTRVQNRLQGWGRTLRTQNEESNFSEK